MRLTEINPFIRYVHFLEIDEKRKYGKSIPLDHRLFYLSSGNGKIAFNDTVITLNVGDAVIIPSGTVYELLPTDKTAVYVGVNFDYTQKNADRETPVPPIFSGEFDEAMRFETPDFKDAVELNSVLFIRKVNGISSKLVKMEKEYSSKLLGFRRVLSGILSDVIIECVRANRAVRFRKSEKTVTDIIEYVDKNFASELSLATVADVFRLHPNYLSYLIKCYTGMPLHHYLMHVRVTRAMGMLSTGEYTVSEVAVKCGFVDIYHFSKVFTRFTGVNPSKYPYIM